MESTLLLDVVVREGPAVLQLLAGEDEPLLVRRDALLVLDLGLYVLDRVRGLDLIITVDDQDDHDPPAHR